MRRLILAAALTFAAPLAQAQEQEKDEATGSAAELAAAFHPRAKLYWNRDGSFAQRTLADFIAAAATGKPARTGRSAGAGSSAWGLPAMPAWPRWYSIIRACASSTISRW